VVLQMAHEAHRRTRLSHLVLAGGVALNCVANGRLLRDGPFDDLWIQPAAGDAGGALGAALFVWHQLLDKQRPFTGRDHQKGSLLGPAFPRQDIERLIEKEQAPHEYFADETVLLDTAATLLAEGKIVGWFNGRMEFGPRALGARSILGDPCNPA